MPDGKGASVKVELDRQKGKAVFTVSNSQGQESKYEEPLGSLLKHGRIYPFVHMFHPNTEVEVQLSKIAKQ